jgi:mannose-6-phosphate isomerase-like protein (cupin superfamily)
MEKEKKSPAEVKFRKKIEEDMRPWGRFRSYPWKQVRSIKIITVNPGSALSLQYHHKRSEFWVVLDSGLEMTLGKKTWTPKKGEEIFIPKKIPHRLRCVGSQPARVMELWLGQSEEEDIVRLRDDYGRIP